MEQKRRYTNPMQFFNDCIFLLKRVRHIRYAWIIARPVVFSSNTEENVAQHLSLDEPISPQFRERLLLAVTSVNSCSACSYIHTKVALNEGLKVDEINNILDGDLSSCLEEEIPALLYAQHWADVNGMPDPESRNNFILYYGKEKSEIIEFCLGAIRIGNMLGNTVESLRWRNKHE